MALIGNILVFFQLWTMIRLRRRVRQLFPAALDEIIWRRRSYERLAGILFPKWFNEMVQLHRLVIFYPERLPVYILGDDETARIVRSLRKSWIAYWAASLVIAVSIPWKR